MHQRMDSQEGASVLIVHSGSRMRSQQASSGFTLIEMMVTVVVLAILTLLAMPSMSTWIRTSKVRSVAESLQNGLRQAQNESVQRSRQTVFSLTDDKPHIGATDMTAKEDGVNWSVNALKLMETGESSSFVTAGILTDVGSGVAIDGPASICFNSVGRVVANSSAALTNVTGGATCSADALPTYDINLEGARRLRVVVGLGGQVRMCDRDRSLATSSDGCNP